MLPAFVIGLREGLETVVIIGAIAVFLRSQDRVDLLRGIWRVSLIAALISVAIGFLIRIVEINLSFRGQEEFETLVGVVAVATITYMVVWMRRFPKNLRRASDSAASSAFIRGSGRALGALAFFAVLREGFEIAVFVVATIGITGTSAWLATGGAFLGVAVALVVGIGVVSGSVHLDVARFFRLTAIVLVITAAGIAVSTVHDANAAGWITFGQNPQFDLSWIAPPGSVVSSITTGMFGLEPYPVIVEVIVWFAYLTTMLAVVLAPNRHSPTPSSELLAVQAHRTTPRPSRRSTRIALAVAALLVIVGLVIATVIRQNTPSGPRGPAATTAKVLFATLDGVACRGDTCTAVGDFLPLDKDALGGDPDGDGRATRTLAERSDGGQWKIVPSPNEGRGGAVLASVACPTVRECLAVGYYKQAIYGAKAATAPANIPLAESFNGRGWHLVATPRVASNSVLVSISCSSAKRCLAVGYASSGARVGGEHPLVESFDGKRWALDPIDISAKDSAELSSVACGADGGCVAVGNSASLSNPSTTHPLVEQLDGNRWTEAPLPSVGRAAGILYRVTCISSEHCVAVGTTEASRASGAALVLTLIAGRWVTNDNVLSRPGDITLTAVACVSAAECVVGGTSSLSLNGGPTKVLAVLSASGWHEINVPASANVDDLTCAVQDDCVAVGSTAQNLFGNTRTLIAVVRGGSWQPQPSAVP